MPSLRQCASRDGGFTARCTIWRSTTGAIRPKLIRSSPRPGRRPAGRGNYRSQPLPDQQIARLESIGLVRLSLAALDGRSRELIRLKFNEDLSYAQISERTGLKTGHIGYLLHHALRAIAAELAKTGVVP